jgi:hypothetical protein
MRTAAAAVKFNDARDITCVRRREPCAQFALRSNQDLDIDCGNDRRMLVTRALSRPKVLRRAAHTRASNICH